MTDRQTDRNWKSLINLVRYPKYTADLKLKLPVNDSPKLITYVDEDHGGDLRDRKAISGNIVFYEGGAVSWSSKKQTIVASSTTETEYVSATIDCQEIQWLLKLTKDMGIDIPKPVVVYEDNQSYIPIAEKEDVNTSTKNIDLKYHLQKEGTIKLIYCPKKQIIADAFTKPLLRERCDILRMKMDLVTLVKSH